MPRVPFCKDAEQLLPASPSLGGREAAPATNRLSSPEERAQDKESRIVGAGGSGRSTELSGGEGRAGGPIPEEVGEHQSWALKDRQE